MAVIFSVKVGAENILTIRPDHHGDWIKGVAAKPIDETLFLIIKQSRFVWSPENSTYRLEARPMHNPKTVLWSINLNELPGVQAAIDHAEEDSRIIKWQLISIDDSLVIMADLLTSLHPKPNLLFRVNNEGTVVASRELELYMPQHVHYIESVHLEPSQHGPIIAYDGGIVFLNTHDLSTKAGWVLDQKSGPGLGSMLLSASTYGDEIFVVGLWVLEPGVNRLSVRIKKLALHTTIEEVGEVDLGITSNTWSKKTYDVLATEDRLLTIGGTDSWQLMACEHSRELVALGSCNELQFAPSVPERMETKGLTQYHPSLIHTPKGYIWDVNLRRRFDDGSTYDRLIATKSNGSASLRALNPGLDSYSFISSWSLLPDKGGDLFVLTSIGSHFDGHRYYSLKVHTVPDQP